jgi:hypothetical protein
MARRLIQTLAAMAALTGLSPAHADVPGANQDLAANAALYYWKAIQALPRLDAEKERLVEAWKGGPPPPEVQKLIDRHEESLRQLQRGARQARCEWVLDYDQGDAMRLAHVQEAGTLAKWACLRARAHFEAGRDQAGVDDLLAALTLARHNASDPLLVTLLVQYAIENRVIQAVAPYLTKMDAAALRNLAARLETLPKASSLKATVLVEKQYFLKWLIQKVQAVDEGKPEDLVKLLSQLAGSNEDWRKKAVESAGRPPSPARVVKQMEGLEPSYDELAELAELPWKEWPSRWRPFEEKRAANPWFRYPMPNLNQVRLAEALTRARWACSRPPSPSSRAARKSSRTTPTPTATARSSTAVWSRALNSSPS